MPVVAKQLGNTGSTGANRLTWNFNLSGSNDDMDLFRDSDLQPRNVHNAGIPFSSRYVLRKILSVTVYGVDRVELRLPFNPLADNEPLITSFTHHEVIGFFETGYHDFSNIGGLPLCIQRAHVRGIPGTDPNNPPGRVRASGDLISLTNQINTSVAIEDRTEYSVMRCFSGSSVLLPHGDPLGAIVEFRV